MLYLFCKGGAGKPPLPSGEELVQRIGLLCLKPLLAQFDMSGAWDFFLLHNRACKTEMKAGKHLCVHVIVLDPEPSFQDASLKVQESDPVCLLKESFS